MAEENGVDLDQVAASAPGGRITRADVQAVVRTATPMPVLPGQSVLLSPVRRITAERMAVSARTVAPVTLTTEADATELARIRATLKAELDGTGPAIPSFTDMIVRFVALALIEHPALNATFAVDALMLHEQINIGIAVDTERGLLAPVVRDAASKSLRTIAVESARLVELARAGTINTADLNGGTFTISNLGMFEIDAFTPIINLPESAVLGVGRVVARPVVVDEENETIEVRKMMALSLTFDHRVVDGAPAARFLQRVKQMIERPFGWLMA
jgi:pyruvate dehydrogenase E2 component (dihydrolipoamide acetyltransferase)